MNKINKTITINVPVHAIFEYISDPLNLSKACSNLIAVDDIEPLPNGVKNFHWEYKLANVHFFGTSDILECDVDHCLASSIEGGITGTITWLFEALPAPTQVTLIIEYELPALFVKKHGVKVISRENESAINFLLETLKTTIEKTITPKLSEKI